MAEGNPRETLLKYEDAIESGMSEEALPGAKSSQKGFSCIIFPFFRLRKQKNRP